MGRWVRRSRREHALEQARRDVFPNLDPTSHHGSQKDRFSPHVLFYTRPKMVRVPLMFRAGSILLALVSIIATGSAIASRLAIGASSGPQLLFAAWTATLSLLAVAVPRWWRGGLEIEATATEVSVRRGKLKRSIELRSISFARIHWDPTHPGIGDLELVRAVPTGALRRRLSLVLPGLAAPDRVWAILRGLTPEAASGNGKRLLAQRLEHGERVLWAAHPASSWRRWLPKTPKVWGSLGLSVLLAATSVGTVLRAKHALSLIQSAGIQRGSVIYGCLSGSLGLTVVLLSVSALFILYASMIRPARLDAETRYWVTDRRVLIQRGTEELHLDRSKIVDVISAPARDNVKTVFLVLDGPRARAAAAFGAFGEDPPEGLQPVLQQVADGDAVARILANDVILDAA